MRKSFLLFLLLAGCSFSRGVELTELKGESQETVVDIYGSPVITRQEGDIQMWAYKQEECSVLVFFDKTQTVQFAESRGDCELLN